VGEGRKACEGLTLRGKKSWPMPDSRKENPCSPLTKERRGGNLRKGEAPDGKTKYKQAKR